VLSLTGIWEMPFGKGRRFGSGTPAGVSHLIGGWTVSAIWQAMSGYPLSFPDTFFNGDIKAITLPPGQRTVDRWFNVDAGFERNPGRQPGSHLRTFPLRLSNVRTDGINYWDLALLKHFNVWETGQIQFRAEFLNAFNHPSFGAVNTTPPSGSFGRVTQEMTWPRRIQFGLRFTF